MGKIPNLSPLLDSFLSLHFTIVQIILALSSSGCATEGKQIKWYSYLFSEPSDPEVNQQANEQASRILGRSLFNVADFMRKARRGCFSL